MRKKKLRQFLKIDQLIYRPQGWDEETTEWVIDSFLEIIEGVDGQASGGFSPMTEEEVDEEFEMEKRSE